MIIKDNSVEQINIALMDIEERLKKLDIEKMKKELEQTAAKLTNAINTIRSGLQNGETFNIDINGKPSDVVAVGRTNVEPPSQALLDELYPFPEPMDPKKFVSGLDEKSQATVMDLPEGLMIWHCYAVWDPNIGGMNINTSQPLPILPQNKYWAIIAREQQVTYQYGGWTYYYNIFMVRRRS